MTEERIGSAAEEARKLLDALQDWVQRKVAEAGEHVATGAPECQLCPVCLVLSRLRHLSPGAFDHFAAASANLLAGLAAFVESTGFDGTRHGHGRSGFEAQRIDIE